MCLGPKNYDVASILNSDESAFSYALDDSGAILRSLKRNLVIINCIFGVGREPQNSCAQQRWFRIFWWLQCGAARVVASANMETFTSGNQPGGFCTSNLGYCPCRWLPSLQGFRS